MKLAISNIAWEENNDTKVYNLMQKYSFAGVEIAPTRWVKEQPYDNLEQAIEIASALKQQYNFVVPSMQSIWFGRQEKIFKSEEERRSLLSYTKKAMDYAAAIGCKNLVFGCPRNRNVDENLGIAKSQVEEITIAFFRELGDYAYEKGTRIGMEPNPPIYNTNFINTTKEAIELIEKVNSKGFLLNLDVGTMIHNEEEAELFVDKVHYINHVHISEPGLVPIEHRPLHQQLVKVLKDEAYSGFVSIEMGKQEDIAVLEGAMQYVAGLID